MTFGNLNPRVSPVVDAGLLRRRLTIQQMSNTGDGAGGYTTTWTTVCLARGAIVKPTFREIFMGQQVGERVRQFFVIRFPPSTTISSGMRVVDDDSSGGAGTTYTILIAQDVDGTKRQMRLTCEQIAPGT